MYTAHNLIKLLILIIGGIVYFFGLGWWFVVPLLTRKLLPRNINPNIFFEMLPLFLVAGMITNYGLVLVIQSLKISLVIGIFIAMAGLGIFIYSTIKGYISWKKLSFQNANWFLIGLFISILYFAAILFIPLQDWDSRSIWFFHAKMIYIAGSVGLAAGWQHTSVLFSHVDYPMLVPVMAAQVAYLNGFWNEFLPKISIIFLFLPAILWLFSFARASISFLFLVLIFPFSLQLWMWNGYLDGYLAMFFGMALLLFYRFHNRLSLYDLYGSLLILIFILYFKNEGILAFLAGFLSISIYCFWIFRKKTINLFLEILLKKKAVYFILLFLPFITWFVYRQLWGLQNDLHIATAESFVRISERLGNGSLITIIENSIPYLYISIIIVSYLIFALWFSNRLSIKKVSLFIIAGVIYLSGMITIYLLSPNEINWYLNTSIERTMLSVNACLLMLSYVLLRIFEVGPAKPNIIP